MADDKTTDKSSPDEPAPPPAGLDEQVQHRVEAGVAWITLNRPEVGNAITPDQRDRMIDLLGAASADLAIRAAVITATGKAFCPGADLRMRRDSAERPAGAPERAVGEVSRLIRDGSQRLISAVLDCEVPVIAAVNGTAAGIGAHLAFACDLVIATEEARFIEVFAKRGIAPDGGGAYLVTRVVGPQRAKEMMFFGDAVPADEAHRLGLVNRVVPAADLLPAATEWATRLAAGPTRALATTKWLVNRSLDSDRDTAFAEEALAQELIMTTADAREGIDAFVQRRDPDFHGW